MKQLSAGKAALGQQYEAKYSALSEELGGAKALAEEAIAARGQLQRDNALLKADLAKEAKDTRCASRERPVSYTY